MENDGGMTARIEAFIADTLAALMYDDELVFETAEPWTHQLTSKGESFSRFVPFAFVSYLPNGVAREGDFDLRQKPIFAVLIGIESVKEGVARIGDSNHLGASKIRDLVIAALDEVHPGDGFNCDDLKFVDEIEVVNQPKRYAAGLHFECDWLSS